MYHSLSIHKLRDVRLNAFKFWDQCLCTGFCVNLSFCLFVSLGQILRSRIAQPYKYKYIYIYINKYIYIYIYIYIYLIFIFETETEHE